jgi:NADH dehydrogenase [ubiquinone] 1 alpha subcomplex assembly factor 1
MSDADVGGFSSAVLEQLPETTSQPAHARFYGAISTDLPRNRPQVQRTGYAGWRNRDRAATIFGKSLWDLDPYAYLVLRVKSDGRKYFVNIQTESIVYTDLHQHRLHAQKPGEWETLVIKLNAFVRTNHGEVVEPQTEMMRQKIRTIGVSLTDRVPGPFDLSISRIWANNGLHQYVIFFESTPSHRYRLLSRHTCLANPLLPNHVS